MEKADLVKFVWIAALTLLQATGLYLILISILGEFGATAPKNVADAISFQGRLFMMLIAGILTLWTAIKIDPLFKSTDDGDDVSSAEK